jgi:hypothetical protein
MQADPYLPERGLPPAAAQHPAGDAGRVLTAVARLVAEAPSLREVVSRLAVTLRESIPFERLHVRVHRRASGAR